MKFLESQSAEGTIQYIERDDPDYPPILRQYERMPAGLYVKGRLPDPGRRSVAIVGARACSNYGKNEAILFGRKLAEAGVQVISGMAYGIDSYAQKGALEAGGQTFAVLGTGVDVCYPRSEYGLYCNIIKQGGILSEFEPGSPPEAWHFPVRNRIISALADIVLVVEAKKKSGSLITVDYALEQGKTVYAIPGRNHDSLSAGTNALIEQGAGIACSPEIILQELGLRPRTGRGRKRAGGRKNASVTVPAEGRTDAEKKAEVPEKLPNPWEKDPRFLRVYEALSAEEQSVEELRIQTGLPVYELTDILMHLCMGGFAEEIFPGYYARKLN